MKTGGSEISAAFSNAYVKLDFPGSTVGPGDTKHCSQILPINDLLNMKVSLSGEMIGFLRGSHLQESLPLFGMHSCWRLWYPGIFVLLFAFWLHCAHRQGCLATNPNRMNWAGTTETVSQNQPVSLSGDCLGRHKAK